MIKRYLLLLPITCLIMMNVLAQEKKPEWWKLHYLSEEEMYMDVNTQRSFYETDPPEGPVRNVAEFDQMQAVLIRYPLGIPVSLVKELADDIEVLTIVLNASQEQAAINLYNTNGVNLENCSFIYAPSDSHWTRDYGPWFVFDGDNQPGIVNFPYNRPRPNDNDIPIKVANYLDIDLYGMNLIHTGGNYMTDGLGISASTDLVEEENPTLSKEDIDSLVYHYLGIDEYYSLYDPLDDYIKHIDTWGKFLSPGKVLIGEVPESDYRYEDFEAAANFFKSTTTSWGEPFEVFRVYTPGGTPATPYTNSLIANDKVLVPLTGSQWDDEALDAYEEAMPGYEIVGINYGSWFNTDALHCRAKGIADLGMLYIDHMPILGTVGVQDSYEITADITAASGEDIYSDSVIVYYSVNGGAYQSAGMSLESGDTWTGSISGIDAGDDVSYYLYVADESGRQSKHPYIGQPDPHEFNVFGAQTDEIAFEPDTLKFLTIEDAADGLTLQVINLKSNTVTIQDMTAEASEWDTFYWWIDNMPELPLEIEGKDTVELVVMVGLPLYAMGEMYYDTLTVSTSLDDYHAIIACDSDVVASTAESFTSSSVNLYPNPFTDRLNLALNLDSSQEVVVTVFDLSGRVVFNQRSFLSKGSQTMTWDVPEELNNGHFVYRIKTKTETFSGKIVLHR